MKYIIVAYDKNLLIGGNNSLLWQNDMLTDMKRFRELTANNVVIMGRKTYDSIGHPLPGRQNIVISRQKFKISGVTVVGDINEAYEVAEPDRDIYVIGGGQIFEQALLSIDEILATEINAVFNGDIYFPEFRHDWVEVFRDNHLADDSNKYNYSFVNYVKRQSEP